MLIQIPFRFGLEAAVAALELGLKMLPFEVLELQPAVVFIRGVTSAPTHSQNGMLFFPPSFKAKFSLGLVAAAHRGVMDFRMLLLTVLLQISHLVAAGVVAEVAGKPLRSLLSTIMTITFNLQ
jgi:hypothetical protein